MTNEERPLIHVRLSRDVLKRLDHLAVEMELDRARTLQKVLEKGLPAYETRYPEMLR